MQKDTKGQKVGQFSREIGQKGRKSDTKDRTNEQPAPCTDIPSYRTLLKVFRKEIYTVISRASAPVKASIYTLDILAFKGCTCPGDHGKISIFHFLDE